MGDFLNYGTLYPNLLIEIIIFFSKFDFKDGKNVPKEVHSFCDYYSQTYQTKNYIQPRVVAKICDILSENGKLSVAKRGGFENVNNSYIGRVDSNVINDPISLHIINKNLSYLVYGFKYIYDDYRPCVLPVEYTARSGDKTLGTCFLFDGGIATAKHCIEGAKAIAIQGISKEVLRSAKYEIHENNAMDLLFIRTQEVISNSIWFNENAEILDEVMTMGYPKISGFHNFLTAENATVAARFTASTGQIVSNAEDIWIREKLFLITAKIKGGNSGGPVIKKNGYVIGISASLSEGQGDYDDLGYGTVIPISFLNEIISSNNKNYLNVRGIEFNDFAM